MFKLASEKALLDAFRPRDRRVVEAPRDTSYPFIVRDYFAWTQRTGGYVYVVICTPNGAPTGMAFDRSGTGDPSIAHLCDWCHSYGTGDQIGLLTTDLNSKKRIGVYACLDLSCAKKLEDEANRRGVSPLEPIQRVVEKMAKFASEGLKIDLSGAGR